MTSTPSPLTPEEVAEIERSLEHARPDFTPKRMIETIRQLESANKELQLRNLENIDKWHLKENQLEAQLKECREWIKETVENCSVFKDPPTEGGKAE